MPFFLYKHVFIFKIKINVDFCSVTLIYMYVAVMPWLKRETLDAYLSFSENQSSLIKLSSMLCYFNCVKYLIRQIVRLKSQF